jgi:hypothetical protein
LAGHAWLHIACVHVVLHLLGRDAYNRCDLTSLKLERLCTKNRVIKVTLQSIRPIRSQNGLEKDLIGLVDQRVISLTGLFVQSQLERCHTRTSIETVCEFQLYGCSQCLARRASRSKSANHAQVIGRVASYRRGHAPSDATCKSHGNRLSSLLSGGGRRQP